MEKRKIVSETGKLDQELHWYNSANVLCNYMQKLEFLEMILKNQAIIPRYVVEPLEYWGIKGLDKIAFPMTCFCDIPFSKADKHMKHYGNYGIALEKSSMIEKGYVQPIQYINTRSALGKDFCEVFSQFFLSENDVHKNDRNLLDYLLTTLLYMKPIYEIKCETTEKKEIWKSYLFQDECEWRYIPTELNKTQLPLFIPSEQITDKGREAYSEVLKSHKETWLKFEWKDIRYLIVPDESARKQLIDIITMLDIESEQKYLLISKISISKRYTEDLT